MAEVNLYNQEGQKVGVLPLDPSIFAVPINASFVHEAFVLQEANGRQVIAHTKDRGEVAGSGKKPWKQKGTGRARHGSRRSPIWVGGGVTFGPTSARVFGRKLNRQARRTALAMVLSDKVTAQKMIALESLVLPDAKTKQIASVLKKLPVHGKKVLLVLSSEEQNAVRAARNIPHVQTIRSSSLNVADLLRFEYVCATKSAVESITTVFKKA
ncbi:50S ribosomal protein L4 [Candidatus Uhrbacteria bacterium]|nr:50S ribosomal protein L4 [Candidatus Uhrbacteria bacterium]